MGARISECGRYRWWLTRRWAAGPACGWVMLNPSTADAESDDATIRKCVGYSTRWGFGALAVANLYCLRSTDPRALRSHPEPVGRLADAALRAVARACPRVVVAWGAGCRWRGSGERDAEVMAILHAEGAEPLALDVTRRGFPAHPGRLSYALEPVPYLEAS